MVSNKRRLALACLGVGIVAQGERGVKIDNSIETCYSLGQHTVHAEARLHQPAQASLSLTGDAVQNFALVATTSEGVLWGYVTNLQTSDPVPGALVQVSPGLTNTLAGADGYSEMQLPFGIPYTVTVSAPLYSTVEEGNVVAPQSNLMRRDYALPTSHLTFSPPGGLGATLQMGSQVTLPLIISLRGQFNRLAHRQQRRADLWRDHRRRGGNQRRLGHDDVQ